MASALALYQQTHSEHSPEDLILQHMPMVKRVAIHLKARIPPFMELDELVREGLREAGSGDEQQQQKQRVNLFHIKRLSMRKRPCKRKKQRREPHTAPVF